MDLGVGQVNRALTDILRHGLMRHDDISMLRQLLKTLYARTRQQDAADGSG